MGSIKMGFSGCCGFGLLLAGCASQPIVEPPAGVMTYHAAERAVVDLMPRSGSQVSGRLEVERFGHGIRVTGAVHGLPGAGEYGIHITSIGDCSATDAVSAGPIFNPHRSAHGEPAMGDHMAGDMANITADDAGVARVDQQLVGVTLGGGAYNDVANRAVVVRQRADDYVTQPDGAAGARTACGLIAITLPPPVE